VIRAGEPVFVDTGAWIALALNRDPFHTRAVAAWDALRGAGARVHTSVPVILETFTFIDRNTARDVAVAWQQSLAEIAGLKILSVTAADLEEAWPYFQRRDLHKLSAVDATSFVLMSHAKIRAAFAFDHHFSTAGFRLVD
jgi:predicted nucleic acid-binding protein